MRIIKKYLFPSVVLLIIAALSVASFFIDLESVQETIRNSGPLAPILYILIKSSTVIFAPLSGTALYILSVPVFGFWYGLLYSFLGDLLGAIVSFYISRIFGRPIVKYFTGKKNMIYIEKSLQIMSTTKGFFVLRLGTLTMPEVASYAAGLTKIKFLPFILIHMGVDIIPIVVMTLPGLLIQEGVTLPFIGIIIAVGVLVTVVNLGVFTMMIKKAVEKEELRKEKQLE
jgi:uncharacterized membrane protein YdjX (TVP38/TMEM64 family)